MYQNKKWHNFVGNQNSKNLVEKILLDSIDPIPDSIEENSFVSIIDNLFSERENDLNYLLQHKDFALKNLDKFFAFYYFQYIMQTSINLDHINTLKDGTKLYPLYFTLESEKLTSTRETNSTGYNKIKEINKKLLVNENLLGYLNVLVNSIYENNSFYSFTDILNLPQSTQMEINNELMIVLNLYSETLGREEKPTNNLIDNILLFKKWLMSDISNETLSRYFLSIEEIGNLFFLKKRGSMGKTLTIKKIC